MAKRSVVRLDSVQAVYKGGTYSVKSTAELELENGFVGKLGAIDTKNLDVRTLETAVNGDTVVLIANPAVVKDNNRLGTGMENEYFMKVGEVVRAYELNKHDVVSISAEGFGILPAVGDIVAPNGFQLEKVATLPATGTALKVVAIEKVGGALSLNLTQAGTTYYVLEVVQA